MHFFPWMRSGHCCVQASPRGERYQPRPASKQSFAEDWGGCGRAPLAEKTPPAGPVPSQRQAPASRGRACRFLRAGRAREWF